MLKNLVILGGGESGTGAALLAKAKGYTVFLSDSGVLKDKYKNILSENGIEFEEGTHSEEKVLAANLIIKSPGIPDKAPIIKKAKEKQIDIVSEIEFASRFTKAKFVAITGSNGKTTTTLLTYHLLKKMGLNVGLAGNVGESLAKQVLEDEYEYYVLELSSFQLDNMYKFRAHVAILLNITPDHLDRYDYKFENYIYSKFRITQNLTENDYFITFVDDQVVTTELQNRNIKASMLGISLTDKVLNGAYISDDTVFVNLRNHKTKIFNLNFNNIPLKGKHNQVNAMAAILAAAALGLDETKFAEALSDFKNASHRLEEAGEVNGVRFVNDSKATNVDSVFYALDSFKENLIWIAGGVDKGNDYTAIEKLVEQKVKALICMGVDNSKLQTAFEGKVNVIKSTASIEDAIREAYKQAGKGDVVLLSPACASFDLFKNYEDRGEQFKEQVKKLRSDLATQKI